MKLRDARNKQIVESIQEALREEECTINTTEVDGGRTLHVLVRYIGKSEKLKNTVAVVRKLYSDNLYKFSDREFLLIVQDDEDTEIFDPESIIDD